MVRTAVAQIANTGRNAQGVKLIRIAEDEVLVGVACVDHEDESSEELSAEPAQSVAPIVSDNFVQDSSAGADLSADAAVEAADEIFDDLTADDDDT